MTYTYTHKKTLMPDIFWVLDLLLLLQLLKQIKSADAAYSIPFFKKELSIEFCIFDLPDQKVVL